jgi:hypothetical protein
MCLCLALLLAGFVQADPVEDGAHELAAKIAGRLAPQERAHLVVRNISALSVGDVARVRRIIEAGLPKRPRARSVVEVSLTFSENAGGYLWVAEIHKGEVEMVAVTSQMAAAIARPLLAKRLVWQQNEPLLDFSQDGERIVVLSRETVAVVQSGQRSETAIDIPRVRDPRGRLMVEGNALTAYFPGATCRGTAEPLHMDCERGTADFTLNGEKVRFTPGRNTIEGGRPGDESIAVCGGRRLAAVKDSVVGLLGKNGAALEETELPGEVTARWPNGDGAVVVIHNLNTEQYAAYALSVDCGDR